MGAYGPRMLRLTGRLGDGWLPSVGGKYLAEDEISERWERVREAAAAAGRDPAEITRAANVGLDDPRGWLGDGQLAEFADRHGLDALLVAVPSDDPLGFIAELGRAAS